MRTLGLLGEGMLFETLRLERGHYDLLELHMKRMLRSSDFFGLGLRADQLLSALNGYAAEAATELQRVKVSADNKGKLQLEGTPYVEESHGMKPVVLSPLSIHSSHPLLYHKTTNRELYTRLKARFADAFDVLLWNERGQLTEFTIGNLVVEMEGSYYTPPIECGLLPGTFRAHLLQQGILKERVLTKPDLAAASKVWLINSLRRWVEVRIESAPDKEGQLFAEAFTEV